MSVENSVSIIIPTYNRGRILSKSIKSILEQSYPYWELLIVDDCSTDATTKIGN
jgi:glycosyltransferase involved in cell wall biosynthesis